MKSFVHRYGPWAVVTGASSGLGLEFARALAGRGLSLVLVARRRDRLERLAADLRDERGIEADVVVADLTQTDGVDAVVAAVAKRQRDAGLLVNNAGFALTGSLVDQTECDHASLLHLNVRAPLLLSRKLGPALVARGRGGVINVASLAGFLPMPGWAAYAASKAYLLSLSEALAHEWRPHGVDVLALCPGATETEFAEVAGISHTGMPASAVVGAALAALGRREVLVTGTRNRLAAFLTRLMPRRRRTAIGARVVASLHPKPAQPVPAPPG